MIGTLGDIVFEVSDKRILTVDKIKRSASGKWNEHTVMGRKSKSEFVSPEIQQTSFEITLDAQLGVRPREQADKLIRMAQNGVVVPCIIGSKPISTSLMQRVMSVSDTWDDVLSGGELVLTKLSITLKDYE